MIPGTNANGYWVFGKHMTENILSSQDIVAALQISSGIEEQRAKAVHNTLIAVPVVVDSGLDPRWGGIPPAGFGLLRHAIASAQ